MDIYISKEEIRKRLGKKEVEGTVREDLNINFYCIGGCLKLCLQQY